MVDGTWFANGVIAFFPHTSLLRDEESRLERERTESIRNLELHLGVGQLQNGTLPYITDLCRQWISATHPRTLERANQASFHHDIAIVKKRWEELCVLVKDFLETDLTFSLSQKPELFSRPITNSELSDGQRLLLQMAVLIHIQVSKLDGHVLMLDEPECHLHPSVVSKLVNRLAENDKVGQIWIATHSVPLIAALPSESLWFVESGKAVWAGRRTELILDGLLGGEGGREQIEEFLRLPAQLASNRFAAECLIPPKAVNTAADDPQAQQVRQFLQTQVISDTSLKLLDYGAGVGRLLSAMSERWEHDREFVDAIDYRAFEPCDASQEQLKKTIGSIYDSGDRVERWILQKTDLVKIDSKTVDIVIMCNVLHEIPPEKWRGLFGDGGSVHRLLKPEGKLVILEDMEIRVLSASLHENRKITV